MAWTKEQQMAIDKDGCNIIVSAGAGSGKTAVLTERVIRKLKQGVDINRLLVLTFTKEAANEMKIRIRKSIEKESELKRQLDFIDQAYITTFDSYALSIVKKYHYLLNVSKNINIIDSNIINIKKRKILDEIFDDYYSLNDNKFNKLIEDFCIKDDEQIKKAILKITNLMDLKIDKKDYLENYIKNYYSKEYIEKLLNKYIKLINNKKKEIEEILEEIYLLDNEYYLLLSNNMVNFLESRTYLEIKKTIDFEIPRLKKGSIDELKVLKESFSKSIKSLKELLIYENEESIKKEILKTKDYVEVIIDVIKKLDIKILEEKKVNDTYEFIDISKMAIDIVKNNPYIQDELRLYYNEIMVDEYQDTNDLQEIFISLINNNNVYMVGDIKQSIYRFRNANPKIFKEKYEQYASLIGGMKIDLLKNFRSRKEVLDGINLIFNLIMDLNLGGANYKNFHQMVFGNSLYLEEGKTNHSNNIEIYNYDLEDETYSKEEKEIFIIANDIKEKINNNYQVFDKDTKKLRKATYSDFCIIMDRGTEFDKYKKIFEYLSVPLTIYKDENLTNDDLTYIIKNIIGLMLKIKKNIIDKEFKYFFTSISRCFLIEETDENIFETFKNNLFKDTYLYKLGKELAIKINDLNLSNLIGLIIDKFNFYENLIKIGDISKNIIKIEQIINIANNLNELGYSIEEFYSYLEDMLQDEQEIRYSLITSDTDSVKIMNIHKSKGLEFPICYYSGLHKTFNKSELKERFLFSNTYGIITPIFDEGISDTILKILLKEETNREEISEKIRLFYVALTRAREKMIIVTSLNFKEQESNDLIKMSKRLKYNSFLDILNSISFILSDHIKNIDLAKLGLTKEYENIKSYNYKDLLKTDSKKIKNITLEIENNIKEEKVYSKASKKFYDKEEILNIKKGLDYHLILENDDFSNPKFEITKKLVNHFDITNCNIFKEYEFILDGDKEEKHGVIDLILEYETKVIIVDYKLKNINDDDYLKQLNGYKKFIEDKTKKKTSVYLYSILEDLIKEV